MFAPNDIPRQGTELNPGSNCGAMLCIWGYIICSSEVFPFEESEMTDARKWILHKILSAKGKTYVGPKIYQRVRVKNFKMTEKNVENLIKIKQDSPGTKELSTVEFCAMLKYNFSHK